MKYLILILVILLTGCSVKADKSYEERKTVANTFAKNLKIGDCFRYESDRQAQHSFEKDFKYLDHIHVVLAKDSDALLIAQPEPDCDADSNNSHLCEYWFRTVEFENLYLIHGGEKLISCPNELSLQNMIERLQKSPYSKQFNL